MSKQNTVFVDVREPEEYAASHVKGALNVPLSELDKSLSNLPKDSKLVVYCNSGNRSGMALEILKSRGYTDLENGISQAEVEKHYL